MGCSFYQRLDLVATQNSQPLICVTNIIYNV